MNMNFQLTAITVLLGVSGISQAALTSASGPDGFRILLRRNIGACGNHNAGRKFDDGTNTTIQPLLSSNPDSLPTRTTWSSTTNASAAICV